MTSLKDRLAELRIKKKSLESNARLVTDEIGRLESGCRHEWGEVKFAPEPHVEYRPNLNRPITHGIHLDYETTPVTVHKDAWTRECKHCGKIEKTTSVRHESKAVPQF